MARHGEGFSAAAAGKNADFFLHLHSGAPPRDGREAACRSICLLHMIQDLEAYKKAFAQRTERLVGAKGTARLAAARVVLFGVGGVGGWCAESLVRTGVGHLTVVDPDVVSPTNLNRQLVATTSALGRPKVEVLRERLLDIAPWADVVARRERYSAPTADAFPLDNFDYVVDAIDSLADKALLIRRATASRARLFSSMGAALKMDPQRIAVTEFWKVKGCPLAAALRRRFKREGLFPARKFQCVYSDELLPNLGDGAAGEVGLVNGSVAHATGAFGLMLASLVVRDVLGRPDAPPQGASEP